MSSNSILPPRRSRRRRSASTPLQWEALDRRQLVALRRRRRDFISRPILLDAQHVGAREMDIDAAPAVPHLDRAIAWFLGENFARSQLGFVVVEALHHLRASDVRLQIEEIASVGVHSWHRTTLHKMVRTPSGP